MATKEVTIKKEDAIKFLDALFMVVEASRLTKKEHVQLDGIYSNLVKFINNTDKGPVKEE